MVAPGVNTHHLHRQRIAQTPEGRRQLVLAAYRREFELFGSRELKIPRKPPDPVLVPLVPLLAPQQIMHKNMEEQRREMGFIRHVLLKQRQQGGTSYCVARPFHLVSLNTNTHGFTVAHNKETVEKIFQTVKLYHESMRPSIRPKTRYSTKRLLDFSDTDNPNAGLRSSMTVDSAKNINLAIGRTLSALHFSEVARYEMVADPQRIRFAITASTSAMPLAANTVVIMESTAFVTGAFFKDQCERARRKEGPWRFTFVPWYVSTEYRIPLTKGEVLHLDIEERQLVKKFGLTPSQIKFRRMKIAEFQGDEDLFRQDFASCVTAETLISTERGIIPIIDAETCNETESGKIVAWGPQPTSSIFRLDTKGRRVLRGTADHPVQLESGEFVWLSKLRPGDCVRLCPPRFAEHPYVEEWYTLPSILSTCVIDEGFGRLLGYFMGDGSLNGSDLQFCSDRRDADVSEDFATLLRRYFGVTPHFTHPSSGSTVVRFANKEVGSLLERLDCTYRRADESRARKVRVPRPIFQSPKSVVREFLRGLFESDGSASSSRVRFYTFDIEFARDVQLLLLGFGIPVGIAKHSKKHSSSGKVFTGYVIQMGRNCSKLFADRIGFVSARKQARLAEGNFPVAQNSGRRPAPSRMIDVVESVVNDGREVTYDLTVDPDHVFSANGIRTHNTYEEAWITLGRSIYPASDRRKLQLHLRKPLVTMDIFPPRTVEEIPDGPLWVWELPQPGVEYDLACDVAMEPTDEAEEEGGDDIDVPEAQATSRGNYQPNFSTIQVVRRGTLEQVAEWKGQVDPLKLAELSACLGYFYNIGQIAPESHGIGVATTGHLTTVLRYPNVYRWRYRDRVGGQLTRYAGWDTTTKSKQYLVSFVLNLVRNRRPEEPLIHSTRLYEEIESFVKLGSQEYGAAAGHFDDLHSAWIIALVTSNDEDYSKFSEKEETRKADIEQGYYEPGKQPRPAGADPAFLDIDAKEIVLTEPASEVDGW